MNRHFLSHDGRYNLSQHHTRFTSIVGMDAAALAAAQFSFTQVRRISRTVLINALTIQSRHFSLLIKIVSVGEPWGGGG